MGWIFAIVLIGVLIFFFFESKTTRVIAFAALAAIVAGAAAFFIFIEPDPQTDAPTPAERISKPDRELRDKHTSALTAITIAEVAFISRRLKPVMRQETANDGTVQNISDLFRWQLSGKLINRHETRRLATVLLRIKLYSCPSFFTEPQDRVNESILNRNCAPIGDRSFGLYDHDIPPGGEAEINAEITFDNQPEPRNWRYLISIERVTAKLE